MDILAGIGSHESVTAYAACTIISPKAQTVEARLSSDDGVKVWLNGKPVHTHNIDKTLTLDEDRFPMTLGAGSNNLLIKVYNDSGNWAFALRLWDEVAYRRAISDRLEVKAFKFTDVKTKANKLSIKAMRIPESSVFKLTPALVTIKVYDSNGQVWMKEVHPEGEALVWPVPDDFEGDVRISASQTDILGKVRRGELFINTQWFASGTGTEGVWKTYRYVDGLASNYVRAIKTRKELSGSGLFGVASVGLMAKVGKHT